MDKYTARSGRNCFSKGRFLLYQNSMIKIILCFLFLVLLGSIQYSYAEQFQIQSKKYNIHLELVQRDKDGHLIAYITPELKNNIVYIIRPDIFEACLSHVPAVEIIKDGHTYIQK